MAKEKEYKSLLYISNCLWHKTTPYEKKIKKKNKTE